MARGGRRRHGRARATRRRGRARGRAGGGGRFPGGGGPGGFGPGGGFGGGGFRGGFGGFNRSNKLQGSVFYNLSGAPFDARPFSLNGQPTEKADYFQNRYGLTLGGPVKIPGIYDGASRTSFQLNYSGTHSHAPWSAYSTVPTLEQREGDLSLLDTIVYDPLTGEPFAGNQIPEDRIDPSARDLLQFLPLPNQPGLVQNFHYVTASSTSSDQVTLRLTHSLHAGGEPPQRGAQGGGPGGRGAGFRRPSVSVGLTYRHSSAEDTPTFPTLGGSTHSSSWDVPVSLLLPTGHVFHQLRIDYNRNRSEGQNIFAGVRDVAGEAGIQGASTDPFDWGVPNLSFSSLTSLRDRNPSFAARPALHARRGGDASARQAQPPLRRLLPYAEPRQRDGRQRARQLRLHRPLHHRRRGRRGDPRDRLRSRGLPARRVAAGLGAVRPRPGLVPRPRVEPVPAGRLAAAREPDA